MKTVYFLYLVFITPAAPMAEREKLTKLEYPTYMSCVHAGRKLTTKPGHKAAAFRCVEGQSKKIKVK